MNLLVLMIGSGILAVSVWLSGNSLRRALPYFAERWVRPRLLSIVHVATILPLIATGVLGIVILVGFKTEIETRLVHAVFMLGLWMSAGVGLLVLFFQMRLRAISTSALLSVILALPAAFYFIPLLRYRDLLATRTHVIPLASGLVLIAACYAVLFNLRWRLSE